jgi:CO dehydrogenase/acetyl-CoA synthase epsilon subunit
VDLDEEGNMVGIEIWNASKNIVEPIAEQLMEKVKRSLEVVAKQREHQDNWAELCVVIVRRAP